MSGRKESKQVMNMFKVPILILLLGLSSLVTALPQNNAIPGGVAIIKLSKSDNHKRPVVTYNKRRVMVVRNNDNWLAIVGIGLTAKTGRHFIKIKSQGEIPYSKSFTVKPKKYKTQHLNITNKRKVNPYAKDLDRIRADKKEIISALKHWSDNDTITPDFILPVKGIFTSPFGLRRFFNNQPRKPHSGLDIAAAQGTALVSPADGTVIETGDYFFNGNSVMIDHGQGLVTMYSHMNEINVKPGQVLKRGEKFGTVGQTGRVTGAHLHWTVSLNNQRVDPTLFLKPPTTAPGNPALQK